MIASLFQWLARRNDTGRAKDVQRAMMYASIYGIVDTFGTWKTAKFVWTLIQIEKGKRNVSTGKR